MARVVPSGLHLTIFTDFWCLVRSHKQSNSTLDPESPWPMVAEPSFSSLFTNLTAKMTTCESDPAVASRSGSPGSGFRGWKSRLKTGSRLWYDISGITHCIFRKLNLFLKNCDLVLLDGRCLPSLGWTWLVKSLLDRSFPEISKQCRGYQQNLIKHLNFSVFPLMRHQFFEFMTRIISNFIVSIEI